MPDGRSDHERPILRPDAAELLDALDVHEVPVDREAELQQQQQLRAAADDRGVFAVAREELAGFVDRARTVQVEGRQRHAATGASAFSSPKKSRRPFLPSTRSTASGGSPLSSTFAISTTGWWNGTSVPKRTRVSPTRS